MEETLRNIKVTVTGFAGAITAVFGWMGWLVLLWAGCMFADCLTGTLAAARAGRWSSQKARDGLWHKAGMLFVVFAALALDLLIGIILTHLPAVTLPFAYRFLLTPPGAVLVCGHRTGQHGGKRPGHGGPLPGLFAEGPGSGPGRAGRRRRTADPPGQPGQARTIIQCAQRPPPNGRGPFLWFVPALQAAGPGRERPGQRKKPR